MSDRVCINPTNDIRRNEYFAQQRYLRRLGAHLEDHFTDEENRNQAIAPEKVRRDRNTPGPICTGQWHLYQVKLNGHWYPSATPCSVYFRSLTGDRRKALTDERGLTAARRNQEENEPRRMAEFSESEDWWAK